jgi:heme oxygenase (mycobilin-producing)
MAIKVVIARRVPAGKVEQLKPLVIKLRTLAMVQPGYISGETLVNLADPDEFLVISTWSALENWERWHADPRRAAVQTEIDHLLGAKTVYQIYCHG